MCDHAWKIYRYWCDLTFCQDTHYCYECVHCKEEVDEEDDAARFFFLERQHGLREAFENA